MRRSSIPEAIIDHGAQFDFYDGGGIDIAFLGMAELDIHGNVNVSRFGRRIAGVGGFINITQSARRLVLMGTLTTGGLVVEAGAGTLRIRSEGAVRKVVPQVSHLSFNGAYVASLGIKVLYVTERAVFELQDGLLTLTEIAPGVDLQRDVLAQLDAEVRVAPQLRRMDPRIFHERPMSEQGWIIHE